MEAAAERRLRPVDRRAAWSMFGVIVHAPAFFGAYRPSIAARSIRSSEGRRPEEGRQGACLRHSVSARRGNTLLIGGRDPRPGPMPVANRRSSIGRALKALQQRWPGADGRAQGTADPSIEDHRWWRQKVRRPDVDNGHGVIRRPSRPSVSRDHTARAIARRMASARPGGIGLMGCTAWGGRPARFARLRRSESIAASVCAGDARYGAPSGRCGGRPHSTGGYPVAGAAYWVILS